MVSWSGPAGVARISFGIPQEIQLRHRAPVINMEVIDAGGLVVTGNPPSSPPPQPRPHALEYRGGGVQVHIY